MYPGSNVSFEHDSALGFLTHLNSDELKALLNDDSKLEEIVKDQKQYRDLEKEKELLLASNQSLAEYNLTLQPKFEQSKQELIDKTEICGSLLKSFESKASILAEKSGKALLDAKLSSLQLATSELEESSEVCADSFLAGECDLDEFLDKFLSRRKQMHLEKVKADKMAEMLRQHQYGKQ
ncbi:vacuolar protein sorting-associated protein 37B-like [Nesidiocoris tenuis]|uniref:Vacuolar protein sorting-associated protein 37B-like n=1 Tax=Nesidiocoris tenuis TaxID=355587 RepID=A0ABN7ACG7_9HEMI|nr:vacuolar protein sorting-associated protein 37B-like [Nesidiocoris tenuis]